MTDEQRFTGTMAKMMGLEFVSSVISPCLYVKKKDGSCFPAINKHGELTPECRKWWAENLPETWEQYVSHFMICYNYAEGENLNKIADTIFTRMLSVTLSAENLWNWMRENRDSWLYRECTTCNGSGLWYRGGDKEFCISCNGTGRVAKWDVEKWLEGKTKEVGA